MEIIAALFVVAILIALLTRSSRPTTTDPAGSAKRIERAKSSDRINRSDPVSTAKAGTSGGLGIDEFIRSLSVAKVVHIIDGDTVIVGTGWSQTKIRLDSIDCPEDGQPWGDAAKFGLIKLIGGRTVHLETHGLDVHGRTLATIYVRHASKDEWVNVNERMVTLGHAWVMRKFYLHLAKDRQNKLNSLERWARSKNVGLWRTQNPIPPWQWRNGGKV